MKNVYMLIMVFMGVFIIPIAQSNDDKDIVYHSIDNEKTDARSWEDIKKSGYIRIGAGFSITPPVNFKQNGKRVGIDIELMKMLTEKMNVKPKFIKLNNLEERLTMLEQRRIDMVVSTFSITPERELRIDFSSPYLITGVGILMNKKFEKTVFKLGDLKDHKIALVRDSTAHKIFKEEAPSVKLITTNNEEEAIKILKKGEADGYSNDLLFLHEFVKNDPEKFYTLKGELSADPYGIGVAKESTELLKEINAILSEIEEDGTLKRIKDKYSNISINSASTEQVYTVKEGDHLTTIAKEQLGDLTKWRVIYEMNKNTIKNPNVIQPGQKIILSTSVGEKSEGSQIALSNIKNKINELYDDGILSKRAYTALLDGL